MADTPLVPVPENLQSIVKNVDAMFSFSDHRSDIVAALCLAQAKFKPADQGALNPHFKKNYSDLADVWDVAREHLGAHGIAVLQMPGNKAGAESVTVTTMLACKEDWILGQLTCKVAINNPQNVGSVITYLRRYMLAGALGIVSRGEDDDGESVQDRGNNQPQQAQQQTRATTPTATKAATSPATKPATTTVAAPVEVPEAAKSWVTRFDACQDAKEFHETVDRTRTLFDDDTPEKKALAAAVRRAATRLNIQSKKPAKGAS